MKTSLIVAMGKNRVIGVGNELPWHLPADLKYFKAITMGKPIIMGRKTFESIGRPLPGRQNIVITRNEDWYYDSVECASSIEEAQTLAVGVNEIMIIGGAQIYEAALSFCDRLYITEVDIDKQGDAYFPDIDRANWIENSRESHAATRDTPAYAFTVLDRL